jgi:hypothetical protein
MITEIPVHERKRMSQEGIQTEYDGKWVFFTNVNEDPFSAIPVVIADEPMEGAEQGIYKKFIEEAEAERTMTGQISLLKWTTSITGFVTF